MTLYCCAVLGRFVSLLPFQRRPSVGDQRLQMWNSPHAFLAAGRGDVSDHALLLCSLLLGFGLDALVCVGTVVQSSSESDLESDLELGSKNARSGRRARELDVHGGGGGDYDGEGGRRGETGHMVRKVRI